MNVDDLRKHQAELAERLEAIEVEKAQIVRKLKALDVLLEGTAPGPLVRPGLEATLPERVVAGDILMRQVDSLKPVRKRIVPPHTVRFSPRTSLIDAVQELALKQLGGFNSVQLLKAIQVAYPEFNLSETKHISSPLSDLVKRGVLVVERERNGSRPNIYRVAIGAK